MMIEVRFYTDPACPRSWAAEPFRRRLEWEFDGALSFRPVMAGLARSWDEVDRPRLIVEWLELASRSRMPFDALIWSQNPLGSSYPACQAVLAALEQGTDAGMRYLRRLREGIMAGRRRLDHADALIAEAGPAGLDRERFEVDLRSHAIVEAFGADLEEIRDPPGGAREAGGTEASAAGERIAIPSFAFVAKGGKRHPVYAPESYESLHDAALAAGAELDEPRPAEPLEAIDRFGRLATRELEELCGRPRPVLEAELWSLAREWKLRAEPVAGGGVLWLLA